MPQNKISRLLHNATRRTWIALSAIAFVAANTHSNAATVTWDGDFNDDWFLGFNWDTDLTPEAGDQVIINSGDVEFSSVNTPNLRSVRQSSGNLLVSSGYMQASFNTSQDSLVNGTLVHTGGTVDLNELEIGSDSGDNGLYQLNGGDLIVARGLNGFSLYLGGNHDSDAGGTGTLQILSGTMITRTGVKLGHATQPGTGTFEVQGSLATEIGIGTQGLGDGWWEQNSGSTLKVRIDSSGLTPIFIDDVEGEDATYATFESGSLLDVSYYNHGGPGTWTVMEVEGGDITDNGLGFATGVDTGVWSFNVDNSGSNGLLTVTSTAAAPASGTITWDGSQSSDWNDGRNWDNDAGPLTANDIAVINSGTVDYTASNSVSLRQINLNDGSLTIYGGILDAGGNNGTSTVDGTVTQISGDVVHNRLNVGNSAGKNGEYYLQDGELVIGRESGGYSIQVANNSSSTGLLEMTGGSLRTRAGIRLRNSGATFAVLGSAATEIGVGTHNSIDGIWYQAAGATLKVGIDSIGVTKIFVDDVGGSGTSATFESGALLDVSYYKKGGSGGTWTVMEVENGDIIDNGLALAPGVGAEWSFQVDNSGANGLLKVISTASPTSENVTWTGATSTEWSEGSNWDNNVGPYTQGDRVIINSGIVVYEEEATPNLNAIRQFGGTFLIAGGTLKSTANSNWDSRLSGTTYHTGGIAEINELEIGSYTGETGFYYLSGGDLTVARGLGGYSLHLGTNHDNNNGGTGTIEITGGSLKTRTGVRLGHPTEVGTGTFTVLGSNISQIGIGSQGSGDGTWDQYAGSTLKVGIDYLGVTKIFLDDVDNDNGTSATFQSGALLDVDYYDGSSGGGTWVVMEVENGVITDNGLTFAPGVDTNIWSFSIDNSGTNGFLYVTSNAPFVGETITVGNTPQQKMRYGMDYERLWYWTGGLNSSERDDIARWSAVDTDIDFIRVAMNSKYELTENTFDLSAYTNKIIPMMEEMKEANPNIKFFASPRPLNEAVSNAAWQPYPLWVTDISPTASDPVSYTSQSFDFGDIKCAEYIVKYLLLMKSYDFKISFLDVTNEWQSNYVGGRITQRDMADIHEYLHVTYMAAPWEHPSGLYPGITLTPADIPEIIAPSSWSLSQGTSWVNNLDYNGDDRPKQAISIVASHNTSRDGDAQTFADAVYDMWDQPGDTVPEIWNTETHGWKSTSNENETTSFYYYLEAIRAGFGGINGWLAIGTTNQGHAYILNPNGTPKRNVKYHIFQKLSSTSNYGHALNIIDEPGLDVLNAPLGSSDDDIPRNVAAFIKGNLMTVWVINENASALPIEIGAAGNTIATSTVRQTRWTDPSDVEGVESNIPVTSSNSFQVVLPGESVACYEITLGTETFANQRYEAEDYSHHWGTNTEDQTTYENLGNIEDGDWIRFGSVALEGNSMMSFRVARPSSQPEGLIRVREGSSEGNILDEVSIPVTGGWQNYETIETELNVSAGIYNLYLEFVEDGTSTGNALVNIDWFEAQADQGIATEAPTNITAAPVTETSITLNWDPVVDAIGYTVKRSDTQGGPYTDMIDDTIVGTSDTDSGLTPGTTHYYVVVTRYDGYESDESAEIEVQTVAIITQAPANVTEVPVSDTSITLTWDAVPDAIGYTVKRSETEGGPYPFVDDTVTGTTYTDTGLTAGTQYYYVIVTRYGDSIVSEDSDEIESVPSNAVVPQNITFGQMSVTPLGRGNTFNFSVMNSELGHTYQAQKREDLATGIWVDTEAPQFGTGGILDFVIPIPRTETEHYFRVDIIQQ